MPLPGNQYLLHVLSAMRKNVTVTHGVPSLGYLKMKLQDSRHLPETGPFHLALCWFQTTGEILGNIQLVSLVVQTDSASCKTAKSGIHLRLR